MKGLACRNLCLFMKVFAPLALLTCAVALGAQTFDATNLRQPTNLGATWLVHAGDDPAFARTDFDDSQWARFDSNTSVTRLFPNTHPPILWYRLHVKVAPDESGLCLGEYRLAPAFEIFVNGQRIMQNGQVAPYAPYTYDARLLAPISNAQIATGALVIALRLNVSGSAWKGVMYPGFYTTNLTLGMQHALWEHIWIDWIGRHALRWITYLSAFGLGIVALMLFTAQRSQWEYLWIFFQGLCDACALAVACFSLFHNVPLAWTGVLRSFDMLWFFFTVLMYFSILRIRLRWKARALVAIAFVAYFIFTIGQTSIPLNVELVLEIPFDLLLAGVIPVLVIVHMRRGNREAGILLIPLIELSLRTYTLFVATLLAQIPAFRDGVTRFVSLIFKTIYFGPFAADNNDLVDLTYALSLAVIIVLRSTRISRQQVLLEGELEAARQVQQVLLPDQVEPVPGFTVETVYQPAQQVGGDFFQVLPTEEGGLLVVVGDVAGKGLPAAMLVSVLVGSIRGVAEYTKNPAELLANLNERLVGRGGFSTALVARIAADGGVTIANAGHISPYLDGREVGLPGALPLGVINGAAYESVHFLLPPGSRLAFYSDGVIEAQSAKGELFGFDRAREISTRPAADIVRAAQQFGQQDDITVVTIARNQAIATAA